jgi:hypothetical protein
LKKLSVKTQRAILCALLRNYRGTLRHTRIARYVFCKNTFFTDQKTRAVVEMLILNDGCWHQAWLDLRHNTLFDADSYLKLRSWAAAKLGRDPTEK